MGVNDLAEQLEVAIEECARLERENAQLRRDLDAGFAESDHLSAKYYQRMRAAQKDRDEAVGRAMTWAKSCAAANERAEKAEATIEHAHHTSIAMDGRSAVVLAAVRDILATHQNGADHDA